MFLNTEWILRSQVISQRSPVFSPWSYIHADCKHWLDAHCWLASCGWRSREISCESPRKFHHCLETLPFTGEILGFNWPGLGCHRQVSPADPGQVHPYRCACCYPPFHEGPDRLEGGTDTGGQHCGGWVIIGHENPQTKLGSYLSVRAIFGWSIFFCTWNIDIYVCVCVFFIVKQMKDVMLEQSVMT